MFIQDGGGTINSISSGDIRLLQLVTIHGVIAGGRESGL